MPPRWTRYIEYAAPDRQSWHVTYELHAVAYADDWPPTVKLIPRISIPVRIRALPRSSPLPVYGEPRVCIDRSRARMDARGHTRVRAHTPPIYADDARQTFRFRGVRRADFARLVSSHLVARNFRE